MCVHVFNRMKLYILVDAKLINYQCLLIEVYCMFNL